MSLIEKIEEKEKAKQSKFQTVFWKPQPGEVLEGTIAKRGETITSYGEQEYVDIAADDGTTYTVFLTSFLKTLLDAEGAEEGDRVAIKFLGIKTSAKNKKKTYKDWVVAIEKGG
ncbi:MAG: hypothetical protein ACK415_11770 [Thermodesulfovibrionales bacterium]